MTRSLADPKAFVLSHLQQRMGQLSKQLIELEEKNKNLEAQASEFDRRAKAQRLAIEVNLSRAREVQLEYDDFKAELKRQQGIG